MKNAEPVRVSVCLCAYNREKFIREAIDSVLRQDFQGLEIVVVDDASTDATAELLASYGDRIRSIRRERNSGLPAVARNEAVRAARGGYVAFLDSDDVMLPGRIAAQVAHLDANPDHALCHGYVRYIDSNSKPGDIRHEGAIPASGRCVESLLDHCFITTSAVMVRRAVAIETGLFNERPDRRIGEDYEFFMRIALRHPIGFIPEVMSLYRVDAESISRRPEAWRQSPNDIPTHEVFLAWPEFSAPGPLRDQARASLRRKLLANAINWRERGQTRRTVWFLSCALRHGVAGPAILAEAAKALVGYGRSSGA